VEAPPEPAKPEPTASVTAEASSHAVPVEAATNLLQGPGDLDLRVHLTTDILVAFVEFGVAADLGVAPIGPGTLAVGAELNLGLCVTACGLVGALTGFDISDRYITPHARLTYHFLPPAMRKRPTELDLYGLFLAGVTLSTQTITGTVQGVSVDYQGTGAGLSLGVGAGAKLFFKERFFVGGEARLRYARGTYDYEEEVGGSVFSGVDEDWSQSGLSLLVFAGLRL
ncbi:hypothetical protein D7V97_23285, partial [Corallococcus sp. CA053C]|uniref:hypothetical protein n=1 Tax=Corallococcus sp. CA053C TaxID=2316732 RepID=UPI000ED5FA7D